MHERIDQRRSPRISCNLPVEYKLRGGRLRKGRMTNIGTNGMLLTTHGTAPPVGADLLFRFRLPQNTRAVQAVGNVRWADVDRAGVEFVRLSNQEEDTVRMFCEKELARQREQNGSDRITAAENYPPTKPE